MSGNARRNSLPASSMIPGRAESAATGVAGVAGVAGINGADVSVKWVIFLCSDVCLSGVDSGHRHRVTTIA